MTPTLLRYLHTLPHLRPGQIAWQILRRTHRPRVPQVEGLVRPRDLHGRAIGLQRSRGADEFTFRFLNVEKTFNPAAFDWLSPEMSRLWRYNLHYFDYLHETGRPPENVRFLLSDWIEKVPPGTPDAWDPFPVSLRIVNWIKLFLRPEWKESLEEKWLSSLFRQALWLERNLERHLLANHFFKNAKALCFAGAFFEGPDAERWLEKGRGILEAELREQILPDGGHFERSPMYHSMILEDCLDLMNLGAGGWGLDFGETLREKCRAMVRFLLGMCHPDGEIALFNDAAFGIEASPAELVRYFREVTKEEPIFPSGPAWSFPEAGYFIMAPRPGDRLIVDCGPVGPDYQPGHAHCDTLSFELSLGGRRVIVDSGCHHYLDDEIRRYNRGNRGHNTVTLNGENQSEVWGAHRVAWRARPLTPRLEKRGQGIFFSGAHDGYRRLPGSPVLYRRIEWDGSSYRIEDRLEGRGIFKVESRFHIHPSFSAERLGRKILLRDGETPFAEILSPEEGEIAVAEGWYSPEFGLRHSCPVIVHSTESSLPATLRWRIKAL